MTRLKKNLMSLADGSVIARLTDLPVEPQKTDIVYSGRKGRAWIWDIAIDKTVRLGYKVYGSVNQISKLSEDFRLHLNTYLHTITRLICTLRKIYPNIYRVPPCQVFLGCSPDFFLIFLTSNFFEAASKLNRWMFFIKCENRMIVLHPHTVMHGTANKLPNKNSLFTCS